MPSTGYSGGSSVVAALVHFFTSPSSVTFSQTISSLVVSGITVAIASSISSSSAGAALSAAIAAKPGDLDSRGSVDRAP